MPRAPVLLSPLGEALTCIIKYCNGSASSWVAVGLRSTKMPSSRQTAKVCYRPEADNWRSFR
jgi:hypothetical protein